MKDYHGGYTAGLKEMMEVVIRNETREFIRNVSVNGLVN